MARIDDLGDKLRLGMNKLQAAVGETAKGGEVSISLEEAEALRQEEMEGVRERFSKTVAELNDQIGELKNNVRRQDEVIESKLKGVSDMFDLGMPKLILDTLDARQMF